MWSIVNVCILCLKDNVNRKSILSQDNDGIVIIEKCKFVLNEHVNIKAEVTYICLHCLQNLNNSYNFKQTCLRNINTFNNNVDTLGTYKNFNVTLTNPKYYNEFANETPSTEVVVVNEEISDDIGMQENQVLEEEEAMHQDDKLNEKEMPEDIHDDRMQYSSSLCEESYMQNFQKKVKKETETKVTPKKIYLKDEPRDEQVFEAYSNSEDNLNYILQNEETITPDQFSGQEKSEATNMQYSSSLYEDRRMENFLKKVKLEDEFKVTQEEIHIKDEQLSEATDSDSEDKLQNKYANSTEVISTSSRYSGSRQTLNNKQFDKKPTKPQKYDVCDKSCAQGKNLKANERVQIGERPFECDLCQKTFIHSYALLTHKRVHTGKTTYKCDVCNKLFSREYDLKIHKRIHTGEKPYECDVCKKAFSVAKNLKRHASIHTGEKPYECYVCNKAFAEKINLKRHTRIHIGERTYKCHVCQQTFNKRCNLAQHKRGHIVQMCKYACDVCQKTFTHSRALMIHKRLHTSESPYKCDVCNKVSGTATQLKIHKRIHTGDRPYNCNVCKKAFSTQSNFKRHIRLHTGENERQYECDVCPKIFRAASSLKKHKLVHTL